MHVFYSKVISSHANVPCCLIGRERVPACGSFLQGKHLTGGVQKLRNTNLYCPSRVWVVSIALLKTFTTEMFFGLELTLNCSERIQRPTSQGPSSVHFLRALLRAEGGSALVLQCFIQTLTTRGRGKRLLGDMIHQNCLGFLWSIWC